MIQINDVLDVAVEADTITADVLAHAFATAMAERF